MTLVRAAARYLLYLALCNWRAVICPRLIPVLPLS